MDFDGSIRFSVLVPAPALVASHVRFPEVGDGEHHTDPVGGFHDSLLETQSAVIGYHLVCVLNKLKSSKLSLFFRSFSL